MGSSKKHKEKDKTRDREDKKSHKTRGDDQEGRSWRKRKHKDKRRHGGDSEGEILSFLPLFFLE